MDIMTLFLAQIWGPVILAVGVGVFVSRSYYLRVYRDLEKDALAVLVFGLVATTVGLLQVQVHNTWDTVPEILVSLLGWGLLLKGLAFLVVPNFVDRSGNIAAKSGLIHIVGGAMLLLGIYLSWLAYF